MHLFTDSTIQSQRTGSFRVCLLVLLQAQNGGGDSNPEVCMTGKQRHDRDKWKQERDQADQQRLARATDAQGSWKREWDREKSAKDSAG